MINFPAADCSHSGKEEPEIMSVTEGKAVWKVRRSLHILILKGERI